MPTYSNEEMQAWADSEPFRPIANMIFSPDRLLISSSVTAEFTLQDSFLEIIIDGDGLVDITTDEDLFFVLTEDDMPSQNKTIDLDLLPGTPIILQGGSGTLTMTSRS